jgi:hypothetical protein
MPTLHITNLRFKRRLRHPTPKLLQELRQRALKRAKARKRRGL